MLLAVWTVSNGYYSFDTHAQQHAFGAEVSALRNDETEYFVHLYARPTSPVWWNAAHWCIVYCRYRYRVIFALLSPDHLNQDR